jgi:hypothetical protein
MAMAHHAAGARQQRATRGLDPSVVMAAVWQSTADSRHRMEYLVLAPPVTDDSASRGLIIPLIIQTIRLDPSRSDQIDEASNVSRPDPTGADQIDAEHQATDLGLSPTAVGITSWVARRSAGTRPAGTGAATAEPTRSEPASRHSRLSRGVLQVPEGRITQPSQPGRGQPLVQGLAGVMMGLSSADLLDVAEDRAGVQPAYAGNSVGLIVISGHMKTHAV